MNLAPISHSMQGEGEKPADVGGRPANAGPQRTARMLLLAFALGLCDLTYWQYSYLDRINPDYWKSFIDGVGLAPEQYRIGVKLAAWWMVQHFGWGFRHGFTLFDVVSSLAAVFLLYNLLQRRAAVRSASVQVQWFASAAFIALTCFYLVWVDWDPTSGQRLCPIRAWPLSCSGSGLHGTVLRVRDLDSYGWRLHWLQPRHYKGGSAQTWRAC